MKKTVFILSVCLLLQTNYAQQHSQPLVQNIEGRKTISLDGDWRIIIDPYETGFVTYRLNEDQN